MKTRRMKLSFSKAEFFRASLDLRNSGISMPVIGNDQAVKRFGVNEKIQESFGLFGGSNNANTFHPEVNIPENIIPKPEDFVRVPFRLLSATTVGAGTWKATDFSDETMLRQSAEMLNRKPIYFDHDTDLLNWVGIVEGVEWQAGQGDVPSGINGLLAIDAVTNPKIARGVLIGSIFSNSVTVEFDWEPSHHFDSPYEFNEKIGTYHSDGEMIRRKVKKIHNYHETSLVWLGADPYAKLIDDDGNLVHIDESSTYNLEKDEIKDKYTKDNEYSLSFSLTKDIIGWRKNQKQNFNKNTKDKNKFNNLKDAEMDKELLLLLKGIFGLSEDQKLTKEQIESLQIKDDAATAQLETFSKLTPVDEKGETIELSEVGEATHVVIAKESFDSILAEAEKVEDLQTKADLGDTLLAAERDEVERLYSLSVDNDTDEAIVDLIKDASVEQLSALKKQYSKDAKKKFNFRSSEDGDDGLGEEDEVESASFNDLMEKFGSPTMNLGKK